MKEKQKSYGENVKEEGEFGTIRINNEVISVIAGRAATEIKGVAGLSGGIADGLVKILGRKNPEKGVRIQVDDDGVSIDISILVDYGASIPDVCGRIQRSVKKGVEDMTGKRVKSINVNVHGVQFLQSEPKMEEEKR